MRFPEFSGEWKETTIGECCSELEYGMNAPSKYFDGVNKYIRITDIDEQTSEYKQDSVVSPDAPLEDKYIVKDRDILFARTGASTGKTYIYNPLDGKMYYAGFLIRANVKMEDNPKFVFYQTQTHRYKKWVSIMSMRSGQPGINSQEYASYKFWKPCKDEQDKISALISLLDTRIQTQKKIINKYESLIRGLTDDAFNRNISSPKISFSNLYKDAGEGGTPSTSNSEYYEGGAIPFIKIDDLVTKYLVTHKECITEHGLHKSSAWLIPSGSVIYSNGATIGSISINTYPVCTKQGILGIIPKDNVNVEYLYYFMTSVYFRKEIHRIITEGTMKTAYLKDINKILCPLPCLEKQNTIANRISHYDKKIELDKRVLSLFQTQKKYLLSHLFI